MSKGVPVSSNSLIHCFPPSSPDSAKIFFDDTKASAKDLARDDLIKVLTGKSGDAVNWLVEKVRPDQ